MNAETPAAHVAARVLINTARGDVVDEHALVEVMRERLIAGAGLDVYEFEPTVLPDLRDFENVVLLPHLGQRHRGDARRDGRARHAQPGGGAGRRGAAGPRGVTGTTMCTPRLDAGAGRDRRAR